MRYFLRVLTLLGVTLTGCAGLSGAPFKDPVGAVPIHIPLEPYLGALATLRATVSGRVGTFLFDTGEGITSISPGFARKIGGKPWGRVTGFRMVVSGKIRTRDLIKDGNLGARFLNNWVMTLDLKNMRAWLASSSARSP